MKIEQLTFGSPWSEQFITQIADPEDRREFVRDQVRSRFALLIRALRDQDDRQWSQTELGRHMGGKPQSVVSRIEDPDYGRLSLETMFEVAEAFDLPLWVDLPEWDEWLRRIREVREEQLQRQSFDAKKLQQKATIYREWMGGVERFQLGRGWAMTAANDSDAVDGGGASALAFVAS